MNDFALTTKQSDGIPLVLWNAVQDCHEDCPIYSECPYDHSNKCELRKKYIRSVVNSLEKGIKEKDEIVNMKIGLMLVPLFNQLVTFKLIAHAQIGNEMFISSKKIQINPVFKEIRDIMKDINGLMKELKVDGDVERRSLLNGDSDYYDTMIRNGKVPAS